MKIWFVLSILYLLLNACSTSNTQEQESQVSYLPSDIILTQPDSIPKLTAEQESAFNALNTLQVSTDETNRLYSTFAGIIQPCYPPDTSFTLSQSELYMALELFVTIHCQNLTVEKRSALVSTAVLAQEEYAVLLCLSNASKVDFANGAPRKGTWILPSVLGQRDVIIEW